MFLKKIIALNVIVLGLVCVGCTTTNEEGEDLSTKDTTIENTTIEDSNSKDIDKEVSEEEVNKEEVNQENEVSENNNNTVKEEEVATDKEKDTVEVINEDTGEITEETEVEVKDLVRDKDFFYVGIDEVPSDVKQWVLDNKDKQKEITAYVKTTDTETYILATVENSTGGRYAFIHAPYMISDVDEVVVPYSYMSKDKYIESNGNEYDIMKINKPVKVRLEHATIFEN